MRTRSRFSPLFRFVVVGAFACASGGCAIKLPDWGGEAGGSGGSGGSTEEPGSGGTGVATTGTVAMTMSSSSMTTATTVTTGVGGAPATTTGVGGAPATTVTTGAGAAPATTTVTTGAGGAPGTTTVTTGVGGSTTGVGGAPPTTTGVGGVDPTTTTTTGVGGAPATTTVTTGVGGGVAVSVGVGVGGGTGVGGAPQTTSSAGASITVGVGGSTSSTTTGVGGATSSSSGTSTPTDEACPGEAHTVDLGVTLTLSGSTVGATDDLHPPAPSCFGAPDSSGPDVVYAVTFSSAGTLNAALYASNGLKGVLYAERTCGDAASLAFCGVANGDGARTQTMAVTAGETMYFVVDGDAGTAGDFSLSFDLETATCGDGVQNADEQCDDGNTADGDGCSATCTFEAPVDASDACPGDVVTIDMAETLDIEGTMPAPLGASTTLNYSDNYLTCDGVVSGAPIVNAPDQGGNDRIFRFVPSADGTLFLQLRNVGVDAGGFDAMLSAWANTCTPAPASADFDYGTGTDAASGDYMGCSDHAGGGDTWDPVAPEDAWTQEALTFDVVAGTPYFVVVDGYAGYSAGNFWLHAELTPKQ